MHDREYVSSVFYRSKFQDGSGIKVELISLFGHSMPGIPDLLGLLRPRLPLEPSIKASSPIPIPPVVQ